MQQVIHFPMNGTKNREEEGRRLLTVLQRSIVFGRDNSATGNTYCTIDCETGCLPGVILTAEQVAQKFKTRAPYRGDQGLTPKCSEIGKEPPR